ncbi:WbqC family protein [Tardiphaga sp.]|uniref:WbqC family protein n=1 Tax=Tardiphaga sp. TaxID=1926292 RepID=UPI0026178992|nr:WbqC family protein [Tardiphaga sp.]
MQSNYMPWKGYFDIIAASDEIVLFDEVQYTRSDWRNRNRIVANNATQWLTVPVTVAGKYFQPINLTEIADPKWSLRHWNTLRHSYRNSAHFAEWAPILEALYLQVAPLRLLTEVNEVLVRAIAQRLDLPTVFSRGEAIPKRTETATDRLVEICIARGADTYISGPAARAYIDPQRFTQAGVALRYANYTGYPEYSQAQPSFDHHVSVMDLLFNCGSASRLHLKSLRDRESFLDTP